ncbi:MAG: fibrobacter succinogenes major paralogous domain-containing protein [Bacteroidales bacterium]|nr:fibrobacter succinogenes major paralogous domain-containing protein [Bacteroidales bacterium]
MKKILLTLVLLIGIVVGLFAQKLTYQAVIRDNNQQLVVNTAVKATVTITFTTGVPYAEEVNGSTNIHGLLSFEFGDETLAGRDWTGATIAVKVVNAATPSTVYVNDEARPVSAVPYALNVNGQSIQNYLTEHNYVDETELDSRHYLTSDSAVITTMQGNIANLTQHTTKSAIRDSVAGQIHDSISNMANVSHIHTNKDLLDTYNQTNADLADAVAKKHAHDNAAVLAATTAPYTDADSIKLKGIAEGAEVNVQADWNQSTTTADDYIKNKPTIPTVPTNVSAFNNDAGYITATDVPAQVNADWNATSGTAQILNKPELFSGNYNDLSNKPTIPAAANNATLTIQKNGTSVGTFTADASSDKSINITIPTTTSELTNNSGFITTANVPTNVSQLNNDAGYVSNSNCPTVDLCELYNMMTSLQNTIARQDSMINALNNEHHSFTCGTSTVSDHEGNVYNTVKIGTQCWMAQNLRTSTNAAGAGNIYTPTASEVPGYDVNTYGRLYDWAAVMQGASSSDAVPSGVQGICPTGWHVPSDAEWTQLTTYVKSKSEYQCDGADNIANALSAAIGWSYNTSEGCYAGSISSTINLTGFSAVPAGLYNVRSLDFSHSAFFWSTTESDSNNAYYRNLSSNDAEVSRWDFSKDYGHSVRCLRDASIGGGDNPSEPATMSCEQVMECMGDTLGQLNAKIEAQGAEIETLNGTVTSQGNTIDSLAHLVDSLSNLPHGGNTPATFTCGSSKVKDVDNNEYNTVAIGNQCWLKENLRTKTLQYGQVWTKTDVDSAIYGRYYDWQAAMQIEQGNSTSYTAGDKHRGICPAGWHVPSDAEWTALTDYVKSKSEYQCGGNAANIAKALSQPTGWSNTDTGCNAGNTGDKANATGFSAVPAGLCFYGSFEDFGDDACFWSATQDDDFDAWCRSLYSNASYVVSRSATGEYGFSVRCLRDAGVGGTPGENETGGTTPSAPAMMSCEQVMECMGDTLGRLNAKIEAQGNTIDSLANSVDSLSRLIPDSPGIPTDTFICGTSTVTDHEGNVYNTVQIGDQCWTRENMRCTTSPSTGTNILEFPASSYTYSGKKAYYPNDDASNVATYGLLYNWNAAVDTFNTAYGETSTNTSLSNAVSVTFSGNRRGICPVGWHVPSDAEWTQLTTYVGSQSEYVCGSDNTNIAKALASTTGWSSNSNDYVPGNDPSTNNATGFSAVPAGNYSGSYLAFGNYAYFWSATRSTSNTAYNRTLYYNNANVNSGYHAKYYGYSVRCLRDGGVGGAPATNESGSAGNAGGSPDSGCCTELGARMDSLQNVIDGLQNTVSSQDSVINALNNELHPFVCGTSKVTDHEGNVYNTVQVGDQCWTKENMRCTTSPSTGTSILEYPASSYSYTGKNAYYPNDNASNVATYGLLYNWCAAVDTFNTAYGETSTNTEYSNAPSVTFGGNRRGICPVGWHVPSNAEWDTLTSYVKSQSQYVSEGCTGTDNANSTYCIAKALASTTGWSSNSNDYVPGNDPSTNNATGFSAVPAGVYGGSYGRFGNDAYFWSATQNSSRNAYDRGLDYGTTLVDRYGSSKFLGFSVRCLRD